MQYANHYTKLIHRAKHRTLSGYKERHHIIPRCMGGTNDADNIAELTAREHFVAHLLLVKMHPSWPSLILAVQYMCIHSEVMQRTSRNRMYGWLREKFSRAMSENQTGSGNSQYGTCWIYRDDIKQSRKIPKDTLACWLSNGWSKGRKLKFDYVGSPNDKKKLCRIQHRICKKCGENVCLQPDICQKRVFPSLIELFGFDESVLGTTDVYDEYERVRQLVHDEYHVNELSTVGITKKYNVTSTVRLDSIFRSLGIKPRSLKEAVTLYYNNRSRSG